jgi:hypothetical protein
VPSPAIVSVRAFLERINFGRDVCRPFRIPALGLVQRRLGFSLRIIAPFVVSFPGSLLAPSLHITALLFLRFRRSHSGVPLADLLKDPDYLAMVGGIGDPAPGVNL